MGPVKVYTSPYQTNGPAPQESVFTYLLPETSDVNGKDESDDLIIYTDAGSGESITRGQLRSNARRIAYGLRASLGSPSPLYTFSASWKRPRSSIMPGGKILVFSPNTFLVPQVLFSCFCAGIIVVMSNATLTPSELAYQIKDSEPTHLFVHPGLLGKALAALESLGVTEKRDVEDRVLLLARKTEYEEPKSLDLLDLDDLVADGKELAPMRIEGAEALHRTCIMFYSSGTTGLPKGVPLTHYNIVSCSHSLDKFPNFGVAKRNDVSLGPIPYAHVYGFSILCILPVARRSTALVWDTTKSVVDGTPFEGERFVRAIAKYGVSYLYLVPPIANFLANTPLLNPDVDNGVKVSTLRSVHSSAAALAPATVTKLIQRLVKKGANPEVLWVFQGYGMTEMSPGVTGIAEGVRDKIASAGVLLPNVEARLVDYDTGVDVPEIEEGSLSADGKRKSAPGELWLRGPNMMDGYYKKDEQNLGAYSIDTSETYAKGRWFKTGDIAICDEDGYLYIVDRRKELIKNKGFQVSPVELEALIVHHESVQDVAVIGVPDNSRGDASNELPRAYVVPKDLKILSNATGSHAKKVSKDISDFVAGQASHYKHLSGGVTFIQAIPRSAAGKILRRELQALAAKDPSPSTSAPAQKSEPETIGQTLGTLAGKISGAVRSKL